MQYIDSHIHLQDYNQDAIPEMVKKAINIGIKRMVCAGTSPQDWQKVADYAHKYPDLIIPAFGVHPWHFLSAQNDWKELLQYYLSKFSSALVGEIGMDKLKPDIELQQTIFAEQLQIAKANNRPVVIHAVKAISLLANYWHLMPKNFLIHSFSSSLEQLREVINHGGYVSFNQSIEKNRDFEKIVQAVPQNRILLESDGPYQSLNKSETSTPLYIPELAKKIASVRGENFEDFAKIIYNNSMEFINV